MKKDLKIENTTVDLFFLRGAESNLGGFCYAISYFCQESSVCNATHLSFIDKTINIWFFSPHTRNLQLNLRNLLTQQEVSDSMLSWICTVSYSLNFTKISITLLYLCYHHSFYRGASTYRLASFLSLCPLSREN